MAQYPGFDAYESSLCGAIRDNDTTAVRGYLRHEVVRRTLRDRSIYNKKYALFNYTLARKGFSPLHVAASFDRHEILKFLVLEYGAQVNAFVESSDGDRWTPLHEAVRQDKLESVKTLLALGADVALTGRFGNGQFVGTPIQWAQISGASAEELLVGMLTKYAKVKEKQEELFAALDLQTRLSDAEKELENRESAFQIRIHEIDQKKIRIIEEHDRFLEQHRNQLAIMRADPAFRTPAELALLTEEVAKNTTSTLAASAASSPMSPTAPPMKSREEECPVCLEIFSAEVYSCPGCDGLLCGTCVGQLNKCPLCRQSFRGNSKPLRNRAVERILNLI